MQTSPACVVCKSFSSRLHSNRSAIELARCDQSLLRRLIVLIDDTGPFARYRVLGPASLRFVMQSRFVRRTESTLDCGLSCRPVQSCRRWLDDTLHNCLEVKYGSVRKRDAHNLKLNAPLLAPPHHAARPKKLRMHRCARLMAICRVATPPVHRIPT